MTSGLPKRNGNRHAEELANLALDLVHLMTERNAVFLDNETISLRIGINTGKEYSVTWLSSNNDRNLPKTSCLAFDC